MAAPEFVPVRPGGSKYYESPPRRPDGWQADRPGEVVDDHPTGPGLGRQGPDQGYALSLVRQFEDEVVLQPGERWSDVAAGGVYVALKRASIFGRAPVRHDLAVAFTLWGFFDESPDPALVELRRDAFDRVDNPHHYLEARRIIDAVPEDSLRCTPTAALERYSSDWRLLLDLEVFEPAEH